VDFYSAIQYVLFVVIVTALSPGKRYQNSRSEKTLLDQVPPGAPVMKEKRAEISYAFEELPTGGMTRLLHSHSLH
jgi:hypothetical protein